jgi:hypothetical protein
MTQGKPIGCGCMECRLRAAIRGDPPRPGSDFMRINTGEVLAAQIAAIPPSNDPTTQAALDQLTATLTANDSGIAAAVTANTPAAQPSEPAARVPAVTARRRPE